MHEILRQHEERSAIQVVALVDVQRLPPQLVPQVLLFSLQIVDLANQVHILRHDSRVVLLMHPQVLLELVLESFYSGFQVSPFLDELLLQVDVLELLLGRPFGLHVFVVEFK